MKPIRASGGIPRRGLLRAALWTGCGGWLLLTGCGAPTESPVEAAAAPELVKLGKLEFVPTYAAGQAEAQATGKPMMIFFTAEWCRFCHQMAEEAFAEEQVAQLADRFICVVIDADVEPAVCQEFNVEAYPTVITLSSEGVILGRMKGKRPPAMVVGQMQSALDAVQRRARIETSTTLR